MFLPHFVRCCHANLMRDFRLRGTFSHIGGSFTAFIVKNGAPYKVDLGLDLFPSEEGFLYVTRLTMISQDSKRILFDNEGRIHEYSKGLDTILKKNIKSEHYIGNLLPDVNKVFLDSERMKRTISSRHQIHAAGGTFKIDTVSIRYPNSNILVGVCTL